MLASYAKDFPFASYKVCYNKNIKIVIENVKVKQITIHEEYVLGVRDQADIALIEVAQAIKFVPEKVGPICLPSKIDYLISSFYSHF